MVNRLKNKPKQAISNHLVDKQAGKEKNQLIYNRLLAFCVDTCIMIAPIAIINIGLLLIVGGFVVPSLLSILVYLGTVMLVLSIFGANTYLYVKSGGRSIGKKMYGFQVVKKDNSRASNRELIMREVIGYIIPFMGCMLLANLFGVIIFWLLNALCFIANKRHKCMIDYLLGTQVVRVRNERSSVGVVKKIDHIGIDLHIHSNFSANGKYNVEEIFQLAKQTGLKTISITDLDSVKHNYVALQMSELYKINYVPGIEINAQIEGKRVRILGYFIDYTNELYTHIENDSLVHEKQASIKRVGRFEELLGVHIPLEPLLEKNRFQKIPGEMIAKYVLEHEEYEHVPLLQPYIYGAKKHHPYREIAKDFFAFGKSCYVEVKYPELRDILDVIALSDGIGVLAHPGKFMSYYPQLFEKVIDAGIQGLEVFHPRHSREEMAKLLKIATERNLLVSAGSGFFNENSGVAMGESGAPQNGANLVNMWIKSRN